jgi:hypothetical protein
MNLKKKFSLRNPTDFQFSLDMSSLSNTNQSTDPDAFQTMIAAMERVAESKSDAKTPHLIGE